MKRHFFVPVLFFLTIVFVGFLLAPRYKDLRELQKQATKERANFQEEDAYFQTIKQSSEKLKDYEAALGKIETALPGTPSLAELLSYVQETSSQSGLLLESMAPKSGSSKKQKEITSLQENTVSLTLAGSYIDFKAFLGSLERSARLIEIENINIETEEKVKKNLLTFHLLIKVYSY